MSNRSWSKARCRNVEYTATTGWVPAAASPAALANRCCSAMPESNTRCGYRLDSAPRPVGRRIAAVSPTTSDRSSAMRAISSSNTSVQLR
ncbi:Uncharacterised protein [Mycobacterium tuberculosis]|nr:Uncharacterised protein [Mycobacterium tuberculosis]